MQNSILEELVKRKFKHDFRIGHGANGRELLVKCPFCPTPSNKYKLYVNCSRDTYHCFKCEASGAVTELVNAPVRLMQAQQQRVTKHTATTAIWPGVCRPLTEVEPEHPVFNYLQTRTPGRTWDVNELSDVFGVSLCISGRTFANGLFNTENTLILPIYMHNNMVGWQSRLLYEPDKLTDEQCAQLNFLADPDGGYMRPSKYLTSPGLNKGTTLFNFDLARKYPFVVITEGPFDAMSVGPNAVATLGKGVTDAQSRLIKVFWSAAIVLLDPGDADREAKKLGDKLSMSIPTMVMNLKGYKDAGDAPRQEIWKQISARLEADRRFPIRPDSVVNFLN